MASLIGAGGYWVLEGRISIGVLVTFLGYIRNLFQPVRDLVEKYNTYLSAKVSAERVSSVLMQPREDCESGIAEIPTADAGIEFENVSFRYAGREDFAIKDVSFSVPAKTSLAVVGATGSGKSTLVRMLLRFYDPTLGRVLLHGRATTEWNRTALRSRLGVVHQEVYLIEGMLLDNLCMGRAGFPEDVIVAACERVGLWEHVRDRGGLSMKILEGGANLSAGEKQLVAFTRIVLFDPPVLILDEATASLDRVCEARVMSGISELIANRTSIIIAHRLSTVQNCDEVMVLDKGCVAERGTYAALSKSDGLFKSLLKFHEGKSGLAVDILTSA
jgi:ATP-binding cassette subfamily B protein